MRKKHSQTFLWASLAAWRGSTYSDMNIGGGGGGGGGGIEEGAGVFEGSISGVRSEIIRSVCESKQMNLMKPIIWQTAQYYLNI